VSESSNFTVSEVESKKILRSFDVRFAEEGEAFSVDESVAAAKRIGFPVVLKLLSDSIAHKTERGLVKLNIRDEASLRAAATELLAAATPEDGRVSLLVAKMEAGRRELIVGLVRDAQFGAFVMLGLGGVFAELHDDFVFAPVPVDRAGARRLIARLRQQNFFAPFRGERAVDLEQLTGAIVGVSELAESDPTIASVDINPLIVRPDGSVVAVDALIEKSKTPQPMVAAGYAVENSRRDYLSLFEPSGVVVVGASTHPGKFGFVSLHNILANGYRGRVFATNLDGSSVLGLDCLTSLDDLPQGLVDLAFVCTPSNSNEQILRACAAKGVRAVYVTSAGYADSGEDGRRLQEQLARLADELGLLLVGPNGQGIVSTAQRLCAQIVAPFPPPGRISVVSQSGNFSSSFMNYSRQTGVGIARAVSVGNAAQVGIAEFADFFGHDDQTAVILVYIEGIDDGRKIMEVFRRNASTKPIVAVKGGATSSGSKAASSHTGAIATNDLIFDGLCESLGVTRVRDIEQAFDVAASFATQPLPKGRRTVVLTTVGGWGVVTADVIAEEKILELIDLPDDLMVEISRLLPSRWSRNNPIDCAGGETRETVVEIMGLVAAHPKVDAVILLGIGIQSNQAKMMREGGFYDSGDLARIVDYHENQDRKYAKAAAELSILHEKPILVATELGVADPSNPGVVAVGETNRLCYASGQRAARALGLICKYSLFRQTEPTQ